MQTISRNRALPILSQEFAARRSRQSGESQPRPELQSPGPKTKKSASTSEVEPPSSVQTSTQSQEITYDVLKDAVIEAAGGDESAWRTGPDEVNLIGIRSLVDGEIVEQQGNVHDDTIYAVWVDEEGEQHIEAFRSSVDAGVRTKESSYGLEFAPGQVGNSHLANGFYRDAFEFSGIPIAGVPFTDGLRQRDDLRIHVDKNNDGVIDEHEKLGEDLNGDGLADGKTVGWGWGIYFHPSGSVNDPVNEWSQGCQVIVQEDYARFEEVIGGVRIPVNTIANSS